MRPMIDSHLDLAYNALGYNRDLFLSVEELNRQEAGMTDAKARGKATLTFPELRRCRVPICVATLLCRSGPDVPKRTGTKRVDLDYATQQIAYAHAQGQLHYYRLLAKQGHLRIISTQQELREHWETWQHAPDTTPLGIILSMEGADPIVSPEQVVEWWADGLRAVGPAHYGRSHYAYGTAVDGPLTPAGVQLLKEFMKIGMILDVTHLSDQSFFHAMDIYHGPMLASHHNCRALVPGDRQLSDEQIRILIERDAVIGTAFDAWMMYPGWVRGETSPEVVGLEAAADHIDHICQLAGSARHCALGTDLDGGFGTEQTPRDLKTITDVHKLEDILARRGYSDADIDGIFYGNWLRFFGHALPVRP
jgi:membrane dipeptidase